MKEALLPKEWEGKEQFSIKEIEAKALVTEKWIRQMEEKGILKFQGPKVRGQVRRLFSRADVVNALWFASLRPLGFSPKQIKKYQKLVDYWRQLARHLFKKPYRLPDNVEPGQVLLFDIRDFLPEGKIENVAWEEFDIEGNEKALENLLAVYAEAIYLRRAAAQYQKTLNTVIKQLDEFMDGLDKGLHRTLSAMPIMQMRRELKKK